ncbi:hypothetical protein QE429_004663 [Bacillus sp. SORGH_AS 510]|uniref:DUF6010 family protein n=1 Tax=Bacillus sp. SORGH_AS_0510 TaxID=3041771 RepID=UPI00277D5B15|nr:DUF6010 family protein [Bacillus sp. SORGH_AS_0510]MDQ1147836.1 hypothetical protein [Bacillus sp. SORGH_AS_0510]
MNSNLRNIVTGVLLALLTIRLFYTFTMPVSYQLFTLFLAYTACVYAGAALSDSRIKWISVEFAVSLVLFNFALLGLLYSPIWVGVGFILHGIWDMLHHPKLIKTSVVRWFPPLCAVFDFIVAFFIMRFY